MVAPVKLATDLGIAPGILRAWTLVDIDLTPPDLTTDIGGDPRDQGIEPLGIDLPLEPST